MLITDAQYTNGGGGVSGAKKGFTLTGQPTTVFRIISVQQDHTADITLEGEGILGGEGKEEKGGGGATIEFPLPP